MNEQEYVKYIFIDVVSYSFNRTIEAQVAIVSSLNEIVLSAVDKHLKNRRSTIFLPTGDGIAIVFLGSIKPFDLTISISTEILKEISSYNEKQSDEMNRYSVRIGINENVDNIVTDINGRKNVTGTGINIAQRIMNCGDESQILLGASVFDKISDRRNYFKKFKKFQADVKHGVKVDVYQYCDKTIPYLNCETPERFRIKDPPRMRPNEFVGIYACLIKICSSEIKEYLKENYFITSTIHVGLIYLVHRFTEIIRTTDFSGNSRYDEMDEFIEGNQVKFPSLMAKMDKIDWIFRSDLQEALVDKYLRRDYEYFFQNNFMELSEDGEEIFGSAFTKIRKFFGLAVAES